MLVKEDSKVDKHIPAFLLKDSSTLWILLLTSLAVTLQLLLRGQGSYNNYIIFKTSFSHLVHNKNLYVEYPNEYFDLFLYSPTFALLMAPLTILPIVAQVILWSCLNGICIYYALKFISVNNKQLLGMCLFILLEYVTATMNMQVASMVASFIIFAFVFFEKDKLLLAAFFIVLAAFIKVYAIAAAVLFLLYPRKQKFILYMAFWLAIFLLAPLLVNTPQQLILQYHKWLELTLAIHNGQDNGHPNIVTPLSVMGWLKTWFNFNPPSLVIQLLGTALLCIPFIRRSQYGNMQFRLFILAALLIWSMIFNHIAESASYIVAIMGVAIWLVNAKKDWLTIVLALAVFVFSILSQTDIFPRELREQYFKSYAIKAVPCIILWFVIVYKLLRDTFQSTYC